MSIRRMVAITAAVVLAGSAALPAAALSFEVGASAGGGLAFAYGSYLDAMAEALAELGASSTTSQGSTQSQLLGDWVGGAWGEMLLTSWFSLRAEIDVESAGAVRMALTSDGSPFDYYGVTFAGITVPILARAWLTVGPGRLSATVGPYVGIVAGDITVVNRYSTVTTVAALSPDFANRFYMGLNGGLGYSLALGPGRISLEARADWAFLPVTVTTSPSSTTVTPFGVNLVLGYGFAFGKAPQ